LVAPDVDRLLTYDVPRIVRTLSAHHSPGYRQLAESLSRFPVCISSVFEGRHASFGLGPKHGLRLLIGWLSPVRAAGVRSRGRDRSYVFAGLPMAMYP
jgi:hypothetical protein